MTQSKKVFLLIVILHLCTQIFASGGALTTQSKEEAQKNEMNSPACPAGDANCNAGDKNPSPGGTGGSLTDAPTTRAKVQAEQNQESSPACPASNPYCNTNPIKPIATPDNLPGCPTDNPSCNTTSTNKTATQPDPSTIEIQKH